MKDIAKIANNFEDALKKSAAKSSSKTRNQIDKAWKKSKENYSKLKAQCDKLQREADKINEKLDASKTLLMSAKRDMLHYYKTKQFVDLSGASSVVLYDNDSMDVGYVIDKEEYHLDLNDSRDLVKTPMKEHKKSKSTKKEDNQEEQDEDVNDADAPFSYEAPMIDNQDFTNESREWHILPNFRFIDEE